MRSGTLKHRCTIQQNTPTKAADGSLEDSWADLYTDVWAEIETEGGREFFRQRQLHSELTHEVKIRYKADLKPKMRLVWGTRTFEILSAINDEAKQRYTVLNCVELNG